MAAWEMPKQSGILGGCGQRRQRMRPVRERPIVMAGWAATKTSGYNPALVLPYGTMHNAYRDLLLIFFC
ncbi:hypothetical protein [Gulbenkiania mobilis]|uniref:hypothetical protein n=1 Tax=Gulbenkiania mobilis TaxID=397457 RepID=UPI00128EF4E1|nr:hypothetical protein [Gulbenkiania mobilis]